MPRRDTASASCVSLGHWLDTPVDVATTDMLKEHIRAQVLAEALPL